MKGLKNKMAVGVRIVVIATVVLLGSAMHLWADDLSSQLNIFSPGTTISSSQVNSNFQALVKAMPAMKMVPGNNITLSFDPQNVASLTVTPPMNGTLLLFGTAQVTICQGSAFGGQSWGYSSSNVCITQTSNGGSPGNCYRTTLDTMYVTNLENVAPRIEVPVTLIGSAPCQENTPLTFYLTAYKESESVGSSFIQGSGLIAIFLPGGYMQ